MENVSERGEIDCSIKRPLKEIKSGYSSFAKGDVVVAKITPCFENGKGACLDTLDTEIGFGTTEFINLRPGDEILSRYLYMITMTQHFRKLGERVMTGSAGQKRISANYIKNFTLGIPAIEKFPYVVPDIGATHKTNHFAVIIDEAHSGQNGRNSAQMNLALSGLATDDELDNEDRINAMMEGRKLLPNASYFAFTATPKNKTLETFGTLVVDENGNPVLNEDGEVQHRPFHSYTMKQAIQEGFILDVLKYYTPISSYYKLMKTVQDDPMFDKKRAQKKLRAFVESDSYTISQKAEMMVEHFHEQVISKGKVGGQARAMVVTSSIPRCVEYYYAINKCLSARHSPYKTIVAFSGEHKYQDQEPALTSAGLNGFPDAKIPKMLKTEPYRILIVADMFQTGFDEPLLHTMYVDKVLYDIKAVQTLSRLNRCHPQKHDTFVLDFANSPDMIEKSFSRYYRTTLLSGETDPNKLYDLIATMEEYQVYSEENVEQLVDLYLNGAERDKLDPILDACAVVYKELDTDDQIKFKSSATMIFSESFGSKSFNINVDDRQDCILLLIPVRHLDSTSSVGCFRLSPECRTRI